MYLHVIIDGRSALASSATSLGERQVVEAVADWAADHARTPIVAVVFEGTYEGDGPGMFEHDERTVVVATEGEPAADVIVGEVQELRAASEPVIVATGDLELRARVEALGAKVVDGGSFLRTVLQ